ncbi:DNA polymerase iota-like isoform X2 [Myiozetetes cayanensis]|uniref:DNA polymerase iota-like isoform X2 n=1 Tax=Myiozetetes cayanensis TaxID=478635 RepID=UPI00215FE536|nr:DNA polymerase iota-like isoform X2 [Myiozetetes cayanensis]
MLLKLLRKMIPLEFPFHLTLLSVCFANFQQIPTGKNSIHSYLKPSREGKEGIPSGNDDRAPKIPRIPEENDGKGAEIPVLPGPSQGKSGIVAPPGVDPEVFRELPLELQEEVAAEWKNPEKKPPNSQKKLQRKRKNPGICSQSNNLLKYWKARFFFPSFPAFDLHKKEELPRFSRG